MICVMATVFLIAMGIWFGLPGFMVGVTLVVIIGIIGSFLKWIFC